MVFGGGSVGGSCRHCHANRWEGEIKQAKPIERRHIQMTQSINNENFGGKMVITCNTCHQGQPKPPPIPAIAQAAWLRSGNKSEDAKSSGALPTVDQVFDRYIQSVGGRAAVEKLKMLVLKGSLTSYNEMPKAVPASFHI